MNLYTFSNTILNLYGFTAIVTSIHVCYYQALNAMHRDTLLSKLRLMGIRGLSGDFGTKSLEQYVMQINHQFTSIVHCSHKFVVALNTKYATQIRILNQFQFRKYISGFLNMLLISKVNWKMYAAQIFHHH